MSLLAFAVLLRAKSLAVALRALWPHEVTAEQADMHAHAALEAETSTVSAELLLALAYGESRFDSRAVSRVRGVEFCGATQATATSVADCWALGNPLLAYARTAEELRGWLDHPIVGDRLEFALAGYQGGWRKVGRADVYGAKCIIKRAHKIRMQIVQNEIAPVRRGEVTKQPSKEVTERSDKMKVSRSKKNLQGCK